MEETMKHEVFVIHANHMDLIWKRPWDDYIEIECDIINKALDMIERQKEFYFFIEQTAVLETYLEWYPDKEDILKKYLNEGRLEIIGGAYSLVDLNMPLGESLIRNYIIGTEYLNEKFGLKTSIGCLADAFGQCAQMPQIMTEFGLTYTSPGRNVGVGNRASDKDYPFIWVGADGSSIINGCRGTGMTTGYYEPLNTEFIIENIKKRLSCVSIDTPISACVVDSEELLPRINVLKQIITLEEQFKEIQFKYDNMTGFCKRLIFMIDEKKINPKTFTGEFNPVFTGCYTTRSSIKQFCTKIQNKLLSIEAIFSCCVENGIQFEDTESLKNVWKNLLINQFHDSMCGCVNVRAFNDIMKRYVQIENDLNEFETIIYKKIGSTKSDYLFNPLPYQRKGIVALDKEYNLVLVDEKEPDQVVIDGKLFLSIPEIIGFGSVKLSRDSGKKAPLMEKVEKTEIRNNFYKVVRKNGKIQYISSLSSEKMRIQETNLVIREDKGGYWTTQPTGSIYQSLPADISYTEEGGPLERFVSRGTINGVPWNIKTSCKWEQEIRLWQNEDRIDFIYKIEWNGDGADLSVVIPTPFNIKNANYETPFAVWPRPSYKTNNIPFNDNRGGEWPSLRFVSVDNGDWGISIIHEGCHGIIWNGNDFIINLIHSPKDGNHECGAICWDLVPVDGVIHEPTGHDCGSHEFHFSIVLHSGDWKTGNILQKTESIHQPLLITKSLIPFSDISLDAPNSVGFSALKPSEDRKGIVLRIWEGGGIKSKCTIIYPRCKCALRCGMNEKGTEKLEISNGKMNLELQPFEIVSILFRIFE
jgi:alpha-mannosidase